MTEWSRRRRRRFTVTCLVVALLVVLVGVHLIRGSSEASGSDTPTRQAAASASTQASSAAVQADAASAATRGIAALHRHLAVAALDLTTGRSFVAGSTTTTYYTASIVKVAIATELMRRAEAEHTSLTGSQQLLLQRMIENSDDTAASELWDQIGGSTGLGALTAALHLGHTTPGSGSYWGLTTTTPSDQVSLLRQVLVGHALDAAHRARLVHLMGNVESDQRWGVSAAGSAHGLLVKDGWLPHEADGNRWIVNSIGRVRVGSDVVLMAVTSRYGASMPRGITAIQAAARLAAKAVTA